MKVFFFLVLLFRIIPFAVTLKPPNVYVCIESNCNLHNLFQGCSGTFNEAKHRNSSAGYSTKYYRFARPNIFISIRFSGTWPWRWTRKWFSTFRWIVEALATIWSVAYFWKGWVFCVVLFLMVVSQFLIEKFTWNLNLDEG